jgi:predicted PurR-regulated permease PerM
MNELPPSVESPALVPRDQANLPPSRVAVVGATDVVLIGLFILAIFYTLYLAAALVLPIILALLGAIVFSPVVRALRKWRIPPSASALIVVASLLAAIGSAIYFLADPAADWLEKAPQNIKPIETKLRDIRKPVEEIQKATEKVEEIARDKAKRPPVEIKGPALSSQLLTGAQNFLLATVSAIILLFFLLASEEIFLRKMIHVLPKLEDKIKAVEITRDIESEISRYLMTITLINIGLGIATAIAMYFIGLPNPILWGVTVALLNYIPYLGPFTGLVLLTFVAAMTFDEIGQIALVPATFLCLTTLEGQLLNPMILGERLNLNPVVVFLSLLFWGWLWGVLGVLLAVPILVTLKIVCDHVERLAPLGEFLGERRRR